MQKTHPSGNAIRVGIAGAGAIAIGYAALLLKNGHAVSVWSPTGGRAAILQSGEALRVTGAIDGDFRPTICTGAEDLARCDTIILALPAYGHRFVLDRLLPHLAPRHCVIISGHLSFAALYLAKKLAERGLQIPIAVWSTTVLTCKSPSPTEFRVGALRAKVDMAALPVRAAQQMHALCVALFGDRFTVKDDILTIALSNLNPQDHMGIALCNLTRIERGEAWGQNSNITPTVGRLLEALDRERVSIAASFGKTVRTIFDHYKLSFNIVGDSVAEMSAKLVERGSEPPGPKNINTRYVLEDVPFGLSPTLYLADLAGVAVPLHRSGVEILSACYGRDLTAENDLLPELGLLDRKRLLELVVDGYALTDQPQGASSPA